MTAVRRGTARRFGLRLPPLFATGGPVTPGGFLDFSRCVLTPADEQAFRERWAERFRNPVAHCVLVATNPAADWQVADRIVRLVRRGRIGGVG